MHSGLLSEVIFMSMPDLTGQLTMHRQNCQQCCRDIWLECNPGAGTSLALIGSVSAETEGPS